LGIVLGTIGRFTEIEAWQDARVLVSAVYRCCRESPLGRDFGLRDQIQRSAVSIMANIAEGFGRQRNTEFIQYLRIAGGSCAEVQSHLFVALDNDLISSQAFDSLQEQADKVARKLTNFRNYLQQINAK
jgi:four helix bundle protein